MTVRKTVLSINYSHYHLSYFICFYFLMTHFEGLIYSKVKLQYLGVILYLHQLLCTHIEWIILLVLPFHIQKLREKGQYRAAQICLHNGSQPTGLVGAESQPTLCQAVHPGMGCICLKWRGTLLQFTKRLEALIWSCTLRTLSPSRRGIYSSLLNKEPYGDPPKRNPLLEYKKVQVNMRGR